MAIGEKNLAVNKKARHDYYIDEVYEAGIELKGTEVKSMRLGKITIKDSYCSVRDGEMWVVGTHVSPYKQGGMNNVDPDRNRKLLLHKRQIMKLMGQVKLKGISIVPLRYYLKEGKVKVEIAVAGGKKQHDKRAVDAKRTADRAMERAMKDH